MRTVGWKIFSPPWHKQITLPPVARECGLFAFHMDSLEYASYFIFKNISQETHWPCVNWIQIYQCVNIQSRPLDKLLWFLTNLRCKSFFSSSTPALWLHVKADPLLFILSCAKRRAGTCPQNISCVTEQLPGAWLPAFNPLKPRGCSHSLWNTVLCKLCTLLPPCPLQIPSVCLMSTM